MCGIFSYIGPKKTAGSIILEGLKSLEYRGYDSWGVVCKKTNGKLFIKKTVGKIGDAHLPPFDSKIGFGHTRWATHGGITKANAHPHADCTQTVFVVHNGIVENFLSLKESLIQKGHRFLSETDTEVISHLAEEELKKTKDLLNVTRHVFNKIEGMNAIVLYFVEFDTFTAVKNGSPLIYASTADSKFLASDYSSILNYTQKAHFMVDNTYLMFSRNSHSLHDAKGINIPITTHLLEKSIYSSSIGSYPHYMIKEINEQPKVLMQIVKEREREIYTLADNIQKAFGTYIIGCGTAYYAALAGSYMFSKIAKRHVNHSTGSEFSYQADFLKPKSLVMALSQSGETIDMITAVQKAKENKSKTVAITNTFGSTLTRITDSSFLLCAGPEKCVLATKSFTAKIAVLYLTAHALAHSYKSGISHLKRAIHEISKLIQLASIRKLAKHLSTHEHIYILGRGISYPTALESTLKIKEVSYIHAEGFAAGELKHGVIALIQKGTPVIVYNPDDETYNDTLSSAHEVKARGAYVIGVSSKKNKVYDEYIQVENCNDATIIPNVVVAQLLGYYIALEKKLDPDKPRNLAKSVTVK